MSLPKWGKPLFDFESRFKLYLLALVLFVNGIANLVLYHEHQKYILAANEEFEKVKKMERQILERMDSSFCEVYRIYDELQD